MLSYVCRLTCDKQVQFLPDICCHLSVQGLHYANILRILLIKKDYLYYAWFCFLSCKETGKVKL